MEAGFFENSIYHSWQGLPLGFDKSGATVNSLILAPVFRQASLIDDSTSSAIMCSPNVDIYCLILPVTFSL